MRSKEISLHPAEPMSEADYEQAVSELREAVGLPYPIAVHIFDWITHEGRSTVFALLGLH